MESWPKKAAKKKAVKNVVMTKIVKKTAKKAAKKAVAKKAAKRTVKKKAAKRPARPQQPQAQEALLSPPVETSQEPEQLESQPGGTPHHYLRRDRYRT